MAKTSYVQCNDDDSHFVLDPHADMDLYSASSLKQQSTGRHVAPLGHNYFEQPKKNRNN